METMEQSELQPAQQEPTNAGSLVGLVGGVLNIYARKEHFPVAFHILLVFGVILFLMVAVGSRDPVSVAIMAATLFAAYMLSFLTITRSSFGRRFMVWRDDDKLGTFLGIPAEGGRVGIYLPTVEARHEPQQGEPYAVRSMAFADVKAVIEIVCLLDQFDITRGASAFRPSNLFISETSVDGFDGSTLFLIGGPLPNVFVSDIVRKHPYIGFEDLSSELRLTCVDLPTDSFVIRPSRQKRSIQQVEQEPTYGCVMKLRNGRRTTFAIWGLDERGTRGAAQWLSDHWPELYKEFQEGEFAAIIRFPERGTSVPDAVQRHRDEKLPMLIPV
jgi:hypothetical protein